VQGPVPGVRRAGRAAHRQHVTCAGTPHAGGVIEPNTLRDLASTSAHVRAQTHLVQALSITQAEHTTALRELAEAVSALRQDHGTKLNQIITMLDRLIDANGQ
jgi:ABC-type transporter Mla subunit MlaD